MAVVNLLTSAYTGSLGETTGVAWKREYLLKVKMERSAPMNATQTRNRLAFEAYHRVTSMVYSENSRHFRVNVPGMTWLNWIDAHNKALKGFPAGTRQELVIKAPVSTRGVKYAIECPKTLDRVSCSVVPPKLPPEAPYSAYRAWLWDAAGKLLIKEPLIKPSSPCIVQVKYQMSAKEVYVFGVQAYDEENPARCLNPFIAVSPWTISAE
jgi:hypothetical protein